MPWIGTVTKKVTRLVTGEVNFFLNLIPRTRKSSLLPNEDFNEFSVSKALCFEVHVALWWNW